MKKLLIVLLIISVALTLWSGDKKSFKIGKYEWLTEENTFEEVVKIAKKAKKPILAVFSAKWCGPCQEVKKTVFKKDEFKEVSDKVVLLYIEQTTKKGVAYNKEYNIVAYPTFKIFSKDGVMLDTGRPERTVKGFLKWIADVKGGNNFYAMSEKLRKNPNDRTTLLKITKKMGMGDLKKVIEYLNKVIALNPNFSDKLTKEAYEGLGSYVRHNYPYNGTKSEKEAYVKKYTPTYEKIMKAYYPDKFEYNLKGNNGISTVLEWYNMTGDLKKSAYYFNDFLKRKNNSPNLKKDMSIVAEGIACYLYSGDLKNANKWIDYSIDTAKKSPEVKKTREFLAYFSRIPFYVSDSAKRMFDKKEIKKGRELIYLFYDKVELWEQFPKQYLSFFYNRLAWTIYEGKASDKKTLDIAKKSLSLHKDFRIMDTLASIYSQLGNYKKAVEIEKEAFTMAKSKMDKDKLKKNITDWEGKLKNSKK